MALIVCVGVNFRPDGRMLFSMLMDRHLRYLYGTDMVPVGRFISGLFFVSIAARCIETADVSDMSSPRLDVCHSAVAIPMVMMTMAATMVNVRKWCFRVLDMRVTIVGVVCGCQATVFQDSVWVPWWS